MWIFMNAPISNKLFSNDLEYLIKIDTCNKLGDKKTYIGLIGTVNTHNVTMTCFMNNADLSNNRKEVIHIDISHITSWYILNSCYSSIRYDY